MQFKTFFFTAASALLITPALATTDIRPFNGATINFCNSRHDKTAPGACQNVLIPPEPDVTNIKKCHLIPDSNAKGDKGSFMFMKYYKPKERKIGYNVYSDTACTKDQAGKWWRGGQNATLTPPKGLIYRAIKCERVDPLQV